MDWLVNSARSLHAITYLKLATTITGHLNSTYVEPGVRIEHGGRLGISPGTEEEVVVPRSCKRSVHLPVCKPYEGKDCT